eukprot:3518921-Lingulodinium_polyedra.AAC.1
MINKSEEIRGRPSPNDPGNTPADPTNQAQPGQYETAVGRGVYTGQHFRKARQYALPYGTKQAD